MNAAVTKLVKNVRDLVVPGTHEGDAPGMGGEHLPRFLDRLDVGVDADQHKVRMRIKERPRVAGPAEGRINQNRPGRAERGVQQRHNTIEHHGRMLGSRSVHQTPPGRALGRASTVTTSNKCKHCLAAPASGQVFIRRGAIRGAR